MNKLILKAKLNKLAVVNYMFCQSLRTKVFLNIQNILVLTFLKVRKDPGKRLHGV